MLFKGINQIGFCLYQSLLTFLSRENKISSFYNSSIHKILHCFISWPLSVPASLIYLFPLLQLFFFNGSFQSACKYTQVFLIDKKVLSILLFFLSFTFVYTSLLNCLKELCSHTGITFLQFNSQVIGIWLIPPLYL